MAAPDVISPQLQPQHRPAGHVRLDFVRHVALMRLGGGGGVDGGGFGAGSVNGGLCCGVGLWKTCATSLRMVGGVMCTWTVAATVDS